MQTTLNLILVVLVLILAAILTPEGERDEFRRWVFWAALIGTFAYYVGPLVAGVAASVYEETGVKGTVAILFCVSLLIVILMAWRHGRNENAKIRAGDVEAFNRRVETLMRNRNYSREQATTVVQGLKERQ
jgi:MFS family permease